MTPHPQHLALPPTGGEGLQWGGRRGPKVPTRTPPLNPAPTLTPDPFSPSLEGGEGVASARRAGPRSKTPGPHALIRETARRNCRAVTSRSSSVTPKRISTGTEEPGVLITFFLFGSGRGSGGEPERLSRDAASPPRTPFSFPSSRQSGPPVAAAQGGGRSPPDGNAAAAA